LRAAFATPRSAPEEARLASPTCLWPLNEARVEHLIPDPEVRYVGALGADDPLLPSPEAVGV
jgi:hypothetical protein